jgi:hypothetical protein
MPILTQNASARFRWRCINGAGAFSHAHFGDVAMEVADGVGLELLLRFFIRVHFRQPADPMALQTASSDERVSFGLV